jgi:hypothetical protein
VLYVVTYRKGEYGRSYIKGVAKLLVIEAKRNGFHEAKIENPILTKIKGLLNAIS